MEDEALNAGELLFLNSIFLFDFNQSQKTAKSSAIDTSVEASLVKNRFEMQ